MTENQLRYLAHQENLRHNLATEELNADANAERVRSNLASEAETQRSNVAREDETYRSNTAKEAETERSNRQSELYTWQSNQIKEGELDLKEKEADRRFWFDVGRAITNTISEAGKTSMKLGSELLAFLL